MLLFSQQDSPDPEVARASWHFAIMLHLFSMLSLWVNDRWRGTRIHLYPLMMGFAAYSLAFFFGTYEEMAYYYYYLMVLMSILLTLFFGTTDYYSNFELSGRNYDVGAQLVTMKSGGNRVMMYYPSAKGSSRGQDFKWAHDGDHTLTGLMKFGADILPKGPFRYLDSINQGVRVRGDFSSNLKKVVPVVFSHGIGNSVSFFSTIVKDLAS
jgi:hypothetical protein